MDTKKMLHMATYLLVVVGALNWGLVALLNVNVVTLVFGSMPAVVKWVYVLVGVSAVYEFATHMGSCKVCEKK